MTKFIVKLIAHAVMLTAFIVAFSDASIRGALMTAIGIAVVSYIVGDLLILPRTGNTVATLLDAGLVFLFLWMAGRSAGWTLSFTEMIIIAIAAALFESILHTWILRDDASHRRRQYV